MADENFQGFVIEEQTAQAKLENEGVVVHIKGIDEKPLFYTAEDGSVRPVTITVAGEHSDQYRAVDKQLRQRKLKPRNLTTQTVVDDNIEKLVGCTLAWDGFFSATGPNAPRVPVVLNGHNAKQLYTRCPWVIEQLTSVMMDHASFFENLSTEE